MSAMKVYFQIAECSLSYAKIPNKLHSAKSSALSSNRRNLYHPQKSSGILLQSPYIAFILKSVIRPFLGYLAHTQDKDLPPTETASNS